MTNEQALQVLKKLQTVKSAPYLDFSQALDTAIRVMEGVDRIKRKCEIMSSVCQPNVLHDDAYKRGISDAYELVLNDLKHITTPPTP